MASAAGLVNRRGRSYCGAMAVRPVVIWPDERLRQPSVPITAVDASVRALYQDLVDSMYAENGLRIAALQLAGPRRTLLVERTLAPSVPGGSPPRPPLAFLSPEVI